MKFLLCMFLFLTVYSSQHKTPRYVKIYQAQEDLKIAHNHMDKGRFESVASLINFLSAEEIVSEYFGKSLLTKAVENKKNDLLRRMRIAGVTRGIINKTIKRVS